MPPISTAERERWEQLQSLLDRIGKQGFAGLETREVKQLGTLYRQVTIDLSRARSAGIDRNRVQFLNQLTARAHGQLYTTRRVDPRQVWRFLIAGFPRLLWKHARPVGLACLLFLLTTITSFLAVVREPDSAYSLFDERIVEFENVRLEQQQGTYKGNFTFSKEQSPLVAAAIITNNVRVAITAFALGALLCLPGVFLIVYNGRMLGTLTGLVWNHGFFVDFYSLILTHGVLELTAICISGGSGFLLGWALIAPGQLPRREALRQVAPDAFGLLAGVIAMLIVAGLIEAFITPHYSPGVRWSVAIGSGVLFTLYVLIAGWLTRTRTTTEPSS